MLCLSFCLSQGTPAWNGNVSHGNHNWVEVWLGPSENEEDGVWGFLEGRPAGGGETFTNPCDKWYCNPGHFAPPAKNRSGVSDADGRTLVYAASLSWDVPNATVYPMAWDPTNVYVHGVDRSDYYHTVCSKC